MIVDKTLAGFRMAEAVTQSFAAVDLVVNDLVRLT